jgi:hypothetical protein
MKQGPERVHHQIQDFVQIERPADFFRNVQQKAQLVRHGEFRRRRERFFYLLSHN